MFYAEPAPAQTRVINRRASSSAVIGPAVPKRQASIPLPNRRLRLRSASQGSAPAPAARKNLSS